MPAVPVCARHELTLAKRLVGHDLALEPHRAERAARGAERLTDLLVGRRPGRLSKRGVELVRLEAIVAANKCQHNHSIRTGHGHRLGRCGRIDPEELGKRLDRGRSGSLHLGGYCESLRQLRRAGNTPRDLEIRGEVTVLARDQRVLARARRSEEVERLAATHHPRLGLDPDRVDPAALEDPLVSAAMRLESDVEARLVTVERVRVLHDELPDTQQPSAGPRLVPLLHREVVEDLRELAVALELTRVEGERLLVRQRQDEVATVPVLQAISSRMIWTTFWWTFHPSGRYVQIPAPTWRM